MSKYFSLIINVNSTFIERIKLKIENENELEKVSKARFKNKNVCVCVSLFVISFEKYQFSSLIFFFFLI